MVTEVKVETLEDKKQRVASGVAYKFRDESELSEAQLTDPDYRSKKIAREAGIPESKMLVCSKCHHCR